ncbi:MULTISPECIES: hypothetical protein [unclassified Pseudonocardia]|uniref:hypothetical protein n=1 Tax=unclassified Pseudonocardia TaxID=2619320 RepID=UPI00095E7358|nr:MULTISPECIES: hypothetical protein [unclassified Pseudonocardia]MBN9097205.1 hypothetical protein [Pseudonocardia sp.]OJY39500.1 MAG: hypothetical protein BGP03_30750 [Pseudonocardia sp. 73-21]
MLMPFDPTAPGTGFLTSLHDQEQRLADLTGVDVLLLRPGLFFESFLPALDAIRTHGAHVDSRTTRWPTCCAGRGCRPTSPTCRWR